jgi:HEPN domain-containing protein
MSSFARALWRQAQHDLGHAHRAQAMGDFDWAVLAAQQAGEKALKAVLVFAGRRAELTPSLGHSLGGLFDALVAAGIATREDRKALNEALSFLTLGFSFARCPNAELGEAPVDLVTTEQAATALRAAAAILAACRAMAAELDA